MEILIFLLFLAAAAAAGYALLICAGLPDLEAWALGRIVGPALVAFPAWWAGSFGLESWAAVGAVILAVGCAGGIGLLVRRRPWRAAGEAEAVFMVTGAVVLWLRHGRPEILQTEKFMDLGILATLLRTQSFPPPDMWLAGESLPYYYWGSLVWALPMRLSGLAPEIGYNLAVAAVGGSAAAGLWVLGRWLAGGRRMGGAAAVFFGLFAGTPDGWRQLFAGIDIRCLDLWASSRQVPDTITEFPLFTLWLGDLHPHLLSLPLAVAAVVAAAAAGRNGLDLRPAAVASVLFGLTWAANPWAMPPTAVGVVLMVIAGDGRWRWPDGQGRRRWIAAVGVVVGGWIAAAPFHLAFDPPSRPVRTVFAWTRPTDLLLYGGILIVPACAVAVGLLRRWGGADRLRSSAAATGIAGAAVVVAAATGRPTMVLLSVAVAVLVAAVLDHEEKRGKPALALAALGLFLFLAPEMVYLEDGYGDQMHRMNTVFKAYFQGWIFLAAALPALILQSAAPPWRKVALLAAAVFLALPHPVALALSAHRSPSWALDGLAWMNEGDRSIVRSLRDFEPEATIVEAVGDAYSEYARLSASSGVPAFLGWANHELVWRGPDVLAETGRRFDVVQTLYSSGDPEEVASLARDNGISLIAIGSLERRDFSEAELSAIHEAGVRTIECGCDGQIVVMGGSLSDVAGSK